MHADGLFFLSGGVFYDHAAGEGGVLYKIGRIESTLQTAGTGIPLGAHRTFGCFANKDTPKALHSHKNSTGDVKSLCQQADLAHVQVAFAVQDLGDDAL
jgi:hypothetical protein